MASKRMFALNVIDSDEFNSMPLSTQALYFRLNMEADDEGFVDKPKTIMRKIGANDGDMQMLLSKRYLLYFESGVIVIKHWKLHNWIRQDRITETNYKEEKALLEEKENGVYTERKDIDSITCQSSVSQVSDNCQHSIEENRVVENRVVKSSKRLTDELFEMFWKAYPNKKAKGQAIKTFNKVVIDDVILDLILKDLEKRKGYEQWTKEGGRFIPHPSTYLNNQGWLDEYDITTKQVSNGKKVIKKAYDEKPPEVEMTEEERAAMIERINQGIKFE